MRHSGRLNRVKRGLGLDSPRVVFQMGHKCEAKDLPAAEHEAWHRARGEDVKVCTLNLGNANLRAADAA